MESTPESEFPICYCVKCCDDIFDCMDAPSDNQDCVNCGRPGKPYEMCYPIFCPFTVVFDFLTYPCRVTKTSQVSFWSVINMP